MICTVCKEDKAEKHYHADNKTGWSKLCLSCRKKRNNRVYTRRYILKKKMIAQAEVTNITQTQRTLATQEHYLKKQFKRFGSMHAECLLIEEYGFVLMEKLMSSVAYVFY